MAHPINDVLTLVLPKANKSQMDKILSHLALGAPVVLSPNKAIDIHMAHDENFDLAGGIAKELESLGIVADFCLQKEQGRKKSLLICDMDSTLIGQECIVELADFAGVREHVHEITERAMRGEIGFDGALRERVGLLEGLPLTVLQSCFDERIHLNEGARTLAQTMAKHGANTVIVSGGFTFFTQRVAQAAGFNHHHANILLEDGDKLAGKVADPILGRDAKKFRLDEYAAPFGGAQNAVAIGDGANDLAMIQAAGLGIAYYAKPAVTAAAHCGINHTDLTTALYFQGFKDSEFATN